MTEKRKPGRPRGSGKNDSRELNAVAELMVKNPHLSKTRAISLIVQDRYPPHQWASTERRLLRKMEHPEERIAAARERLSEKRRANRQAEIRPRRVRVGSAIEAMIEQQRDIENVMRVGDTLKRMEKIVEQLSGPKITYPPLISHTLLDEMRRSEKSLREIADPLGFDQDHW